MPLNFELKAEWERAGYQKNMGSSAVVPPPSKDFIRVYHLTSADFAINDIALRRLKIARISDLNDPFELMAVSFREMSTRKAVRNFKKAYDMQAVKASQLRGHWIRLSRAVATWEVRKDKLRPYEAKMFEAAKLELDKVEAKLEAMEKANVAAVGE